MFQIVASITTSKRTSGRPPFMIRNILERKKRKNDKSRARKLESSSRKRNFNRKLKNKESETNCD
jgi:hypothetical protein